MARVLEEILEDEKPIFDEDIKTHIEDYFNTSNLIYDEFDEAAFNKGNGFSCPTFPVFDEKMEGLEAGLYMFAGESNSGKSALLLNLMMDYCLNEENNLYGIYFSLDDTRNELIPRLIAMHESIPISVGSKPMRYQNMIDEGEGEVAYYEELLEKRSYGLDWLRSLNTQFRIEDANTISCGEQIIDYLRKVKAYLEIHAPEKKIICAIDSMSDITFKNKRFKSDKELNDYIAKEVKNWTVELDIPIFGSLHLRKIEQNRRPNIADVKESGRYAYEASFLGVVYNDVSRNKQGAQIYYSDAQTGERLPVIELDWAKNKKSAYKGRTYHYFTPDFSLVRECSSDQMSNYNSILFSI